MSGGTILFLTIVLSNIFSVVVVACLVGKGAWGFQRIKSIFKLDTSKGLVSQGLLWLSIVVPVSMSISLGGWVWAGYDFYISSEGFKKFIEISILPLGIMSLALPLAGLVSRFHSTQQTAKQIEVVSFKNNLDAFYTHRKELLSYFSAMQEIQYFGSITFNYYLHPVLHVRFFNGAPEEGWPIANIKSFEMVEANIVSGAKYLVGVIEGKGVGGMSVLDCYLQACNSIYLAAEALHIREVTNVLVSKGVMARSISCGSDSYDFVTIGTTTLEILAAIRFVKGFYDNLCDFSGVSRLRVAKGHEMVFRGGQRILDKELVIERLHVEELAEMVAAGGARYEEDHPKRSQL